MKKWSKTLCKAIGSPKDRIPKYNPGELVAINFNQDPDDLMFEPIISITFKDDTFMYLFGDDKYYPLMWNYPFEGFLFSDPDLWIEEKDLISITEKYNNRRERNGQVFN